jgi:hypothetical protein
MADYNKEDLSSDEQNIFDAEWDKFVTQHFRTREVFDVFQDHHDAILEACKVAKYQLELPYGGVNAKSNQFGLMPIRPQFLLQTSGTFAYSTATWDRDITTAQVTSTTTYGWLDFIGSSAANLMLSKYATMCIIAFLNPVADPKVDALLMKLKGEDYPVWYFQDAISVQDYPVFELSSPVLLEKEQEIYIQKHVFKAGRDSIRPIGAYFLKGDQMRSKTAYAQT